MPPIEVIINAGGGSFVENATEQLLTDEFAAAGLTVKIHLAKTGAELETFARSAAAGEAEIIAVGGGDGTISTVAGEVYKANKILGVLPLGTLNHFSKDLGIPQDLTAAIRLIAEGCTQKIDIGEVNGAIFINNSSVGLYPRIVRSRELQQQRLGRGKWSAALVAALRVFRINPFYKFRFSLGEREFIRKTPFVFVGNNEYEMDFYNVGTRQRLDGGQLSVYFLHHGGRWGVIRLLFRTVFGLLRQTKEFEVLKTDELTISMRKRLVMVALDGEVRLMKPPLTYKILPAALKVIVPGPAN